jgi:glucose/arabinose dehydrogenase
MKPILLLLSIILLIACKNINPPMGKKEKVKATEEISDSPLRNIKLPEGFKIAVYADNVNDARSLCLTPNGTLFVGNRKNNGSVYALVDSDGDFKVDKKYTIISDLYMPNGVAFRDGALYVAEVNRVLRFDNIEAQLENPPKPVVVYDKYPNKSHHGWKYIAFGPDGKLYIPVGAPCNICESEEDIFNTITRMNPDGTNMEIVHRGIRNTVGFTWHPVTKKLWFTDNGGDWMGDDLPVCELNYAPQDGMHFGFPYCHQGDLLDDKLGEGKNCADYTAPAQKLGPHVAPLGLEFYTGNMFPEGYKNQIFIAEHGSWNRSKKTGYRISIVRMEGDKAISYEPFAEGWLNQATDDAWGRPVDIEWMPDGSMLISDDFANAVYRVSYQGN